jgi:diaminohydroxyphosphoribosylaminopyrimidine deaminase/5-amino-6-(5-phosphoribosylamino)uracil reductase
MIEEDKKYMRRCFDLALLGRNNVSPNPRVGAMVVYNGKVIGEGYHKEYGFAHAEVNAINSVEDKSLLKDSTIYVSLEPCCHWGKTPPCAKLLVESKIKRCVISNFDPNPKVFGGGIKILKDNNIEITTDVLKEQGRYVNRRFFCNQEKRRPYIIIKFAKTLDGFMDVDRKENKTTDNWISNDAMKLWVHKQRSEEDAIMVGMNTVINDNPKLNIRYFFGKNPIRVILDKKNTLTSSFNILDNTQKTIIFNYLEDKKVGESEYIKIEDNNKQEEQILNILFEKGVGSIIVEGGKKTIEKFIEKDLWDEANVITGNKMFYNGLKSPIIPITNISESVIGDNRIEFFYNKNAF